ncbi:CoA pyrophosphatase [Rhizorhabdus dicambivorans]|uniref:Coenzyme A pyrophosphatase n=1 Tax=Rhizorhabdus dicambivorans TaxID=1850238 RepID=A0A2A4G350_9SPHN|nr:CoA pyrophosphatase [Rhizorhabdus dicambivorans]ATE64956.1 coenzyme A pyrophosphatase [Rhizorhabdus dicambivorans]PCE44230.1 coenzyme A pyrophosphatase [Rhizorhabdus dicambivorans]
MSPLAERLRRSLEANPDEAKPLVQHPTLNPDISRLTPAAVLVPIIDAPEPRVLLTVRHEALRAHAGQVAFPGGRLDPEDDGPVAGALREAWEEIGLPPEKVEIVGPTRSHATGSGYLITPVVGVIPNGLPLHPHEAEVAGIFEVPLGHLLAEANHLRRSAMFEGTTRHYFEIDWPHQRIWGVTAGLIVHLAPRLRAALEAAE